VGRVNSRDRLRDTSQWRFFLRATLDFPSIVFVNHFSFPMSLTAASARDLAVKSYSVPVKVLRQTPGQTVEFDADPAGNNPSEKFDILADEGKDRYRKT
jgi:hypothetical protein